MGYMQLVGAQPAVEDAQSQSRKGPDLKYFVVQAQA
jgi:hypothetical protein